MNTFRIKAYAKINLGLDVLRRRPDGYHEVKMIMQTVDLYDDLEFTKLAEDEIRIFTDKEELPADQGNLIWRAAARMKELYQISEGVSVKLTKRIPIAAGMAGGSADAAIQFLKDAGCKNIKFMCIFASEVGIKLLYEKHPDVKIYAANYAPGPLNENGYIPTAAGDAGDRLCGTVSYKPNKNR